MKIKNVSFIEAHIEKLILGVAVLVFLGSVYIYVLGSPNAIEIGGEMTDPGEIDTKLLDDANRLRSKIKSSKPHDELVKLSVPPYRENFQSRASLTYLPEQLAYSWSIPANIGIGDGGEFPKYHVPAVPAPTIAATSTEINTIVADELKNNEALAKRFPDGPPLDVQIVSIAGTFPMNEMVAELEKNPDNEEVLALVPEWWKEQFSILEVEVERQMQNEDGSWSEATYVTGVPGTLNFHNRPEIVTSDVGRQIITQLTKNRLEIIQPTVPRMVQPWAPPAGQKTEVDPRVREIQQLENEILTLNNQLANQEQRLKRPNIRDVQKAQIRKLVERIEEDRKAKLDQINKLKDVLKQEKGDVEQGVPGDDLIKQEVVNWYTVDYNVKSRTVYRYRSRVHVTNPLYTLFSQNKIAQEQIAEHSKKLTLASAWSDWSSPVQTEASNFYFAVSASPTPAPGRVNFEVYKFFDGNIRKQSFRAEPGDSIGGVVPMQAKNGVTQPVNFGINMTLIDLEPIQIQKGLVPTRTYRIVLMDADGNVEERIISEDRRDPLKQELDSNAQVANN